MDQVLDGDQQHFVAIGKFPQLGITRHRAVFIHDFTDHPAGLQTCEPGQIHGSFGVTSPFQDTALMCDQRKDVTRTTQIMGFGIFSDGGGDCVGSFMRRNSGGDSLCRFDADGEIGSTLGFIITHHWRQHQLVGAVCGDGHTDQSTRMNRHEIHHFRSDFLCCTDQVTFVFTVLIIDADHHLTACNGFDTVFYAVKTRFVAHVILEDESNLYLSLKCLKNK